MVHRFECNECNVCYTVVVILLWSRYSWCLTERRVSRSPQRNRAARAVAITFLNSTDRFSVERTFVVAIDTKKFKLKSAAVTLDSLCAEIRSKYSVEGSFTLSLVLDDGTTGSALASAAAHWPAGTVKVCVQRLGVSTGPNAVAAASASPSRKGSTCRCCSGVAA
jgi:hypothetical protein